MKMVALVSLLICALLLTACGAREPDGSDRETLPKESYVTVTDEGVTHRGGLDKADFSADSAAGEWLTQCSASDRDEQFDAYTLRHESASGDKTTFTYLVYYPHGGKSLTPTPEVLEGESGYVVNLTFKAGGSTEGYSLCALTVTLPTDRAPRLRLLYDGEVLGQMATVSAEEIGA
jgi:hypothetical protein